MDSRSHAWGSGRARDTSKAYVNSLDLSKRRSSRTCQTDSAELDHDGETARLVKSSQARRSFRRMGPVPLPEFARRYGATMERMSWLDMWFQTVIKDINEIFGTDVKLETTHAIPRGDKTCTRR